MNDFGKIRRILDLARTAINQQNPDKAIALLSNLPFDEGQSGLEREWAEVRLILAEAYASKGHPVSESLFEEVFDLLKALPTSEPTFELRAQEHFADYLRCFARRPSQALPHFEQAKRLAVGLYLEEDTARIQLKIASIQLSMDQSPDREYFTALKHAAKGRPHTDQLAAWLLHRGTSSDQQRGLKFARSSDAKEAYFTYLLDMVRMKRNEASTE